jgi:coiled-coil domain-containing protein 78
VSRLHVVDLPGCEILNEDPEALRVKQGSTLNRGIQAVNTLMRDLSTNQHGDNVFYEGSTITQLMRDTLGGNSLTLGLFTLQYGDPIGSTLTLRALKRCQQIMNFPVINDNRTIGLLRKYRLEMNASHGVLPRATNPGAAGFSDSLDTYNLKIAELEKKLIEENLEKLRFTDDKQKLVTRMQEMKSKFNELVQSKAELQAELITSEEEKLKVSKALIELQIENTRIQEMVQNG